MAEGYRSNGDFISINDKKYGAGASDFIGRAILTRLDRAKEK